MPQQKKSPVVALAVMVSLLAGALLAGVFLLRATPDLSPAPPTVEPAAELAPVADSPAAAQTAEMAPAMAASSPTPSSTPTATPRPKPAATPETAPPTETPTPLPSPTETPAPTPVPVTFSGIIRNAEEEPVPGAQLYLIARPEGQLAPAVRAAFEKPGGHSMITANQDGRFSVKIAADRAYLAGLMLEGEPQPITQLVGPAEEASEIETTFNLPQRYEVRGTVSDEYLVKLPGVLVRLDYEIASLRRGRPEKKALTATTDERGRFSLRFYEPEAATLTVDRAELPAPYLYERNPLQITAEDFGGRRSYRADLEVVTAQDVHGIVRAPNGDPVQNAAVELRELLNPTETREPRVYETASARDGTFLLRLLPPAEYLATAKHPDFNAAVVRDFKPADSNTQLALELKPLSSLQGIISAEGAPPGPVDLRLMSRTERQDARTILSTDGTAAFRLERVSPGIYLLVAERKGPEATWYGEREVVVGDRAVAPAGVLVLRELVEVSGAFSSAPPSGDFRQVRLEAARVTPLEQAAPLPVGPEGRRLPIASSSDTGTFTLENLERGVPYHITAYNRRDNRLLGAARVVPGEAGMLRLALSGVGGVAGRVRNPSGEACTGLRVHLSTGLGSLEGGGGVKQTWQTFTSYDGTYAFENVPMGQAQIKTEADPTPGRLIFVKPGEVLSVDMYCRAVIEVVFELSGASVPFEPQEQFLVVAKPGYVVADPIRELTLENLVTTLEPGKYTFTRTRTMESTDFEITPRFEGTVAIRFEEGG